MKKITHYLLLFLFLISCKNTKEIVDLVTPLTKPYPHIINIGEGFKNHAEIKLSTIADSIKYIVLSKEKEVVIRNFPFLQMTQDAFYVNPGGLIMKFNLEGKLIHIISKLGRGPQEYPLGSPYTISPSSNTLFVKRNYLRDYLTFNKDGEFNGGVTLLNSATTWEFLSMNDSLFLYTFYYLGGKSSKEMILCGLYDRKGNKIKSIRHPANDIPAGINLTQLGIGPPGMTFYNNDVVLDYFDTIYKINHNSIIPGFILDWDNIPHRQTFEEKYLIQTISTNKVKQYGRFYETTRKAYFGLDDMKKYYLFEYDKTTGVTLSMLADGEDAFGFINDIDGGVNFYPKWTNREGNIWIDYVDAFNFKKLHNDNLSKSISLYPDNKEDLRQFLNKLDIDDNPVLKVVYLKKYSD